MRRKSYISIIGLLITAVLLSGCSEEQTTTQPTEPNTILIDPVFQAFYNYLGGEALLGQPISGPIREGTATVQFVRSGKMVYDPTAPANSFFRMAPLAVEMGITEPPVSAPMHPEFRYDNGHIIYPDFVALYDQLGAEMVGRPVGEIRYNLIRRRYEQYFENLGFYRLEGTQEIQLLDYGIWACGDRCLPADGEPLNAAPISPGEIDILGKAAVDPLVAPFVDQFGTDFTGFALNEATTAGDGLREQILENVVVVADSRIVPAEVALRPLSEALHILPEPPRPYSGDPNMYFVPTQGANLGYEVPVQFWEYISINGGSRMFGSPISHYGLLSGSIYHQCFQNLCLVYDYGANEEARIRPEPLGYAYQYIYGGDRAQPTQAPVVIAPTASPTQIVLATEAPVLPTVVPLAPTEIPTLEKIPTPTVLQLPPDPSGAVREITIQVWERYKVVETQEAQEIGVWLMENGQPIRLAAVSLVVMMPNGIEETFTMPQTDEKGQAAMMLPSIEAANGTMVPYKACYQVLTDARVCVVDYFLIWNNP